jgi:hypothetical protein
MSASNIILHSKSIIHIYRDCLRSIIHMAGYNSSKSIEMRRLVRLQFKRNKYEKDNDKILNMRQQAINALANYAATHSVNKLHNINNNNSSINKRNNNNINVSNSDDKMRRLSELRAEAIKLKQKWEQQKR